MGFGVKDMHSWQVSRWFNVQTFNFGSPGVNLLSGNILSDVIARALNNKDYSGTGLEM